MRIRPRFWTPPRPAGRFPFLSQTRGFAARGLLALLAVLAAGGCSWFAPKPRTLSEAARHQIALKFQQAITQTGGEDVWVKKLPAGGDTFGEVLATREAFGRAAAAFESEASREGLVVRIRAAESKQGRREEEFSLSRGSQAAGRWRLRERSRLLRAAIIMDDLGEDLAAARRLLALPYPLTFSVLPGLPHSALTAEEAHRRGREVMLHLPMEPQPGAPAGPGPGEIKVGMSQHEVARIIAADLASVPFARGLNNHMGSRATADPALMSAVMRVLAARGLYFIDSRTTAQTRALAAARQAGVPAFYRSVFLDDTETLAYSLGQLRQFRRVVEEQGAAISIGHPYPTTLEALAEFLPALDEGDIRLVSASELVLLPEVAHLSPPPPHRP